MSLLIAPAVLGAPSFGVRDTGSKACSPALQKRAIAGGWKLDRFLRVPTQSSLSSGKMWLRGSRELGYTPCDQNDDGCVPYDDDRLSLFGDDRDDAQMLPGQHDLDTVLQQADDATWILSSAFMILTMQSGFSMRKCVH